MRSRSNTDIHSTVLTNESPPPPCVFFAFLPDRSKLIYNKHFHRSHRRGEAV